MYIRVMPALPDAPGMLRLRLIGAIQSVPWNAVQYASFNGPPPNSSDLQTVGYAVGQAFLNAIAQLVPNTVTLTEVQVTDLTTVDSAFASQAMSHTGLRLGTSLPNNVALVASYKINVRYRGGHPRTYWPAGVQADVQDGRTWTDAFRTLAQGACVDYVGNINAIQLGGSNLLFEAMSYYKGRDAAGKPILRPVPLHYPVQTVLVHTRVDSMRTRLGKESV